MDTKILVVDDNARIREMLTDFLEMDGHEVFQAESGQVALEYFQSGLRPDLVVCDLMMPDVDGWQVLESIAQMPEPPRVIVFSSLGDMATVTKLADRYGCSVLKKPEDLRNVRDEARARLDRPV